MAEVQIAGFGTDNAPLQRTTKPGEDFVVIAAHATFDGTAAGSSFLPTLEIVSDAGLVVGRYVSETAVAAGGSADVSFAPFLRSGSSTGIRYDVQNSGGYLHVVGNGTDPSSGDGMFVDFTNSVAIQSTNLDVDLQAGREITLASTQATHSTTGAEFQVDATTNVNLNATNKVQTLSGGDTVITSGGDVISSATGEYDVTAKVLINCQLTQVGATFEVRDHLNNPLLRVTENGTYHILTGAAWVADL